MFNYFFIWVIVFTYKLLYMYVFEVILNDFPSIVVKGKRQGESLDFEGEFGGKEFKIFFWFFFL